MNCPHCLASIDLHLTLRAGEGCGVARAPAPVDRRAKLTEEERAQHRRETQQRYYQNHKEERRERRLANNRAYYQRNRDAILEGLRLKRGTTKENNKVIPTQDELVSDPLDALPSLN